MLAYLRTDPMWFSRFSQVWRWGDWPGREGEVDTGIDLACEHRDGSGFTAVQCKCYAPTTTLDMKDLGTFFTRSGKPPFTERMIIATTNRWTKHLRNATEGQDKPTVKVTLGDLEASGVDWSKWDAAKATLGRKPRKTPHPHQRDAIADVLAAFGKVDRGKLIMACGTGKTYTGLKGGDRGPTGTTRSRRARPEGCCPSSPTPARPVAWKVRRAPRVGHGGSVRRPAPRRCPNPRRASGPDPARAGSFGSALKSAPPEGRLVAPLGRAGNRPPTICRICREGGR